MAVRDWLMPSWSSLAIRFLSFSWARRSSAERRRSPLAGFAQCRFGFLPACYVSPDGLDFDQFPLAVEYSPVGPELPADLPGFCHNTVLDGLRGVCGRQRGHVVPQQLPVPSRNVMPEGASQEFLAGLAEVSAVCFVDKRQGAVGQGACDEFGLVFDNGPIPDLAFKYGPFGSFANDDPRQGVGHGHEEFLFASASAVSLPDMQVHHSQGPLA